ncbi:hypothetical protein HU200_047271 [Digitaria exilis]|uniref:Uncharacterized protein n=1 Tax=Digitaria exilis TaxID=1010633 RepID=A0A835E8H4_9POAL|nr:hypothetical protein HU200_047271 [Digitaria exilis]
MEPMATAPNTACRASSPLSTVCPSLLEATNQPNSALPFLVQASKPFNDSNWPLPPINQLPLQSTQANRRPIVHGGMAWRSAPAQRILARAQPAFVQQNRGVRARPGFYHINRDPKVVTSPVSARPRRRPSLQLHRCTSPPHVSCPLKESSSPPPPPTPDFPAAMAMAVDHNLDIIAPAEGEGASPAVATVVAAARQRGRWLRWAYSPAGVVGQSPAAAAADDAAAASEGSGAAAARNKPRRGGWHALRRRWKVVSGAPSRLAAGLPRWKRVPGLSDGGGWAAELVDAAAFRVMYVVEAVVLGLALSCFFCCCGCQI